VAHDSSNKLTQIPVSGVPLTWNARNELGTFSSISFGCDQFGRRFNANWPSGMINFLCDRASVIRAASPSGVDTAFRIGSGEVFAYTSIGAPPSYWGVLVDEITRPNVSSLRHFTCPSTSVSI
jgi:hypothetical protein